MVGCALVARVHRIACTTYGYCKSGGDVRQPFAALVLWRAGGSG